MLKKRPRRRRATFYEILHEILDFAVVPESDYTGFVSQNSISIILPKKFRRAAKTRISIRETCSFPSSRDKLVEIINYW
jgi:hypothetical protein